MSCCCWFTCFRQYQFIVLVLESGGGIVVFDVYACVVESVGVGTCVSVWVYAHVVSFTSVRCSVVSVSSMVVFPI